MASITLDVKAKISNFDPYIEESEQEALKRKQLQEEEAQRVAWKKEKLARGRRKARS